MLVIVASRHDSGARAILERWAPQGAALMTCEDLSVPGWRHFPGDLRSSTAVVSGQVVPVMRIRGVLTRRPRIFEQELSHIAAADREYVGAEMNAFMLSWLADLACPLLNSPTTTCLSGPYWRRQQWVHAAARVGFQVRPVQRRVPVESRSATSPPATSATETLELTVVGDRCFGISDKTLTAKAVKLAIAAHVGLLTIRFEVSAAEPCFLTANPWPDLNDSVAAAVRDYLLTG